MNRIDHPGIVQCHDFGHLPDGTAFIVMEYLKGETLSRRNRRMHDRMPLSDIVRLVRQIAAALAAAHAKNIVHRDLKPDNVMIVADPEISGGERTKLLDFGIAKLRQSNGSTMPGATKGDVLLGTPAYMSPEQCKGAGSVDGKTDCYALGIMLYRLVSGQLPFHAEGSGEVMALHIFQEPTPLSVRCPWVPEGLTKLVAQLLQKDKDARPSMAEVVIALDQLTTECAGVFRPLPEGTTKDLDTTDLVAEPTSGLGDSQEDEHSAPTIDSGVGEKPRILASGPSYTPMTPSSSPSGRRTGPSGVLLASDGSLATGRPSTLGGSNGIATPATEVHTLRRRLPMLLTLVAVLVGVVSVVASRRGSDPRAVGGVGVGQSEPSSIPARRIRWELTTIPPGATVSRSSDKAVLGLTPWQTERLAGDGGEELRITAPGYAERTLVLGRDRDESRELVLQAVAANAVAVADAGTEKLSDAKSKAPSLGKHKGKVKTAVTAKHASAAKGGEVGAEFEE